MTDDEIAYEIIRTAQIQHEKCDDRARRENAKVGLTDAESLYNKGEFFYAKSRALDSLGYSVGVFHPEFKRCAELAGWK
jgi:hypothetical protein